MSKIISFYFALNLLVIILNAGMAGGGGIASTYLTASMTNSATSMTVASTTGFLSSDVLAIDNEYIAYSGTTNTTFTGLIRGYNGTTPAAHASGKYVYTQETNMINEALGFNVASTEESNGILAVIGMTMTFMGRTLINLILWDYPNIFSDSILIYLRLFLIAVGCGFVLYIAINYIGPAIGVKRQ